VFSVALRGRIDRHRRWPSKKIQQQKTVNISAEKVGELSRAEQISLAGFPSQIHKWEKKGDWTEPNHLKATELINHKKKRLE